MATSNRKLKFMASYSDDHNDIEIDESAHRPAENPTIIQRLKNGIVAVLMGAILFQIILFTYHISLGLSIVLWFGSPFFLGYLAVCGVLGMLFGGKFIDILKYESGNWWNF